MSIVNLLYAIASSIGIDDTTFLQTPAVSQQLLITNISFQHCKARFLGNGEKCVTDDLKHIDNAIMAMIIMTCIQMMNDLTTEPESLELHKMNEKFVQLFGHMDYPPERIHAEIEKVTALQKMFGL